MKSKIIGSLKSKTIWFNLLTVIVLIADMVGFQDFQAPGDLITLTNILGNIGLRFITRTALESK